MNYVLAYSYYEIYIDNLICQVQKICGRFTENKIVFVSAHGVDVAKQINTALPREIDAFNLAHDNTSWEFGGYQVGLDYIKESFKIGDTICVVNDTVGIHSFFPEWVCNTFTRLTFNCASSSVPTIVGEVDSHSSELNLEISGMDANRWIRSCIFSMNYAALDAISWKIDQPNFCDVISKNGINSLSIDSFANDDMIYRINDWLFNKNPRRRWKSSVGYVTDQNLSFLKNKAASIMKEKYLSAMVCNRGGSLENFYYENRFFCFLYRLQRRISFLLKKLQ